MPVPKEIPSSCYASLSPMFDFINDFTISVWVRLLFYNGPGPASNTILSYYRPDDDNALQLSKFSYTLY